jgi:hypothetical protein
MEVAQSVVWRIFAVTKVFFSVNACEKIFCLRKFEDSNENKNPRSSKPERGFLKMT